jgi:hypothetical protein
MIGVLFFTFFKSVPSFLLLAYEWLVFLIGKKNMTLMLCTGPIYGIFEVLQFINLVFVISKYLSKNIDFENVQWYKQGQVWLGIGIVFTGIFTILACFHDLYQ